MKREQVVEMIVAGLVLDPSSNVPIVILREPESGVCLPIWIGLGEATAIASALNKVQLMRPMTHDLLKSVIEELGGHPVRVVVSGLKENTFLANLELAVGAAVRSIDCRPSDAIALAVRVGCPILVALEVLERAQVKLITSEEGGEGGEISGQIAGEEQQDFATIDKDKWAQILASMDPDDFKYKM